MKNKISATLLLLALTLSNSFLFTENAFAQTNKKIVIMNLHCYFDNWEYRFKEILDRLLVLNPDVLAFQEVCTEPAIQSNQIDFIKNYLTSHGYPLNTFEAQYTHISWDRYQEYILLASKHSNQWIDKGYLPQSVLQRGYIAANIDGQWFINIHLEQGAQYAQDRRNQIDFLRSRFTGRPHIVMGDFNSAPYSFEQQSFWDANYIAVFPDDFNKVIDGFWISPLTQPKIDHFYGKVLLNEPINGHFLSDHFAVLLDVQFR